MGKNTEKFKGLVTEIEARALDFGDSKASYLSGAFRSWAEHFAQLCDLKDIELNADQAPRAIGKTQSVVIKLDGVKLTVEGSYTGEEAASDDSAGSEAGFEVESVWAGRTELTDLLTDRIEEIALLAQIAYEEASAEAGAAAEFDARRAA